MAIMNELETATLSTPPRNVLLVDDEINIVSALKRLLRRDGYDIFTATSGEEGLKLLLNHGDIGVIISDQRMPQMMGVDFLREVKIRHPETIRIVLSGYTDLQSVTQAINEGAIYKFLTKPWDDELLRNHIRDAFEHYEIARENRRLTVELKQANKALWELNQNLDRKVREKTREITHSLTALQVSQEILENLPVGIIGIDETHMIAVTNRLSERMLGQTIPNSLLGMTAYHYLPPPLLAALSYEHDRNGPSKSIVAALNNGNIVHALISPMGRQSRSKGWIVVLTPATGSVL